MRAVTQSVTEWREARLAPGLAGLIATLAILLAVSAL